MSSLPAEPSRPRTSEVEEFVPEHTLDYFIGKRGTNKREYIFRYKGARKCDHPRLDIIARGGNTYHCPDCNYTFQIGGVFVQPEHFNVIQSMFTIMRFVRLYGSDSLQEVWRTPIGQTDGTPHKPVLPEGMTVDDVFNMLDESPAEASAEELAAMRDWFWVGPKQRQIQQRDEARQAEEVAALAEKTALKEGNRDSDEAAGPATGSAGDTDVPSV